MLEPLEIIKDLLIELGCRIVDAPIFHNEMWVLGIELDHQPQSRNLMVWVQGRIILFMAVNGGEGRMKELLPIDAMHFRADLADPESIDKIKDFITNKAVQPAQAIIPDIPSLYTASMSESISITWTATSNNTWPVFTKP